MQITAIFRYETLQILLTKGGDLGITYILVLGFEAVLAALFSIHILQEKILPFNWFEIFLVVVGVAFL